MTYKKLGFYDVGSTEKCEKLDNDLVNRLFAREARYQILHQYHDHIILIPNIRIDW